MFLSETQCVRKEQCSFTSRVFLQKRVYTPPHKFVGQTNLIGNFQ